MKTGNVTVGGGRGIPSIGELREPIALVRSSRVPNLQPGATDFIQTLVPYWKGFAKVMHGERLVLAQENADPQNPHTFFIRNPLEISIEARDVLVWGQIMYRVGTTKILGLQRQFLRIRCAEFDTLGNAVTNGTLFGEPAVPSQSSVTSNPFWGSDIPVDNLPVPEIPVVPLAKADYVHIQNTASAVWVVNHNMGTQPDVTVLTTGGVEVEATIQHDSLNTLRVLLTSPLAGRARCV